MNNHNPTHLRYRILKPLLLLLLLFAALPTMAQNQELSVDTMYLDTSDGRAQDTTEINIYRSRDGVPAALVKVIVSGAEGVTFDDAIIYNDAQSRQQNASEYWLWMADNSNSVKITVPGYDPLPVKFPVPVVRVKKMFAYVLKIHVPDKEMAYGDDTKTVRIKITPLDAKPILSFDSYNPPLTDGEAVVTLRKRTGNKGGEYPYEVTPLGDLKYKSETGKLYFDDIPKDYLHKIELKPIYGKLRVETEPSSVSASVYENNKEIGSAYTDIEVQAGRHVFTIKAKGYKDYVDTINIIEGNTPTKMTPKLQDFNKFTFKSSPSDAKITIRPINKDRSLGDSLNIGKTHQADLTSGLYEVTAEKDGYKKKIEEMELMSNHPEVIIKLLKIFNYKNEFYAEGNFKAGTFMGFGATVGAYFMNINAELAYLIGSGKSETIYWSGNNTPPIGCTYTPSTNFTFKLGYGIPLSNRYRLTPQVGVGMVKLKESIEEGSGASPADGANSMMGLVGVRFSAAIANHFGVSVSPEFGFSMQKSKGFEALSAVSSDIKKWGEGFNVKLGLTATF